MPMVNLRLARPAVLVDVNRISELSHLDGASDSGPSGGGLLVGATTRERAVELSSLVRERNPLLSAAVPLIGHTQIRNRGTLGGSIAHADPAADLPAVMVAADARILTRGGGRGRSIAAGRFFVDAFTTALGETEIVTEVRLPALAPRTGGAYEKVANRASHFAIVGVAALVTLDAAGVCSHVRIGITGAGPAASRAQAAESYLAGRAPTEAALEAAAARAGDGIDFTDDLHGSAAYREHLTRRLAFRALSAAVERAG